MQRTLPTHTETITIMHPHTTQTMHTFTMPITERIGSRYNHVGDATVGYMFVHDQFIFNVSYPNKYCSRFSNLQIENACRNNYLNLVKP